MKIAEEADKDLMQDWQHPIDGTVKVDQSGSEWIACCGTWFGEDVWRGPDFGTTQFKILCMDCEGNCPTCGLSLRRHEHDREQSDGEFDLRLYETQVGEWVRFGPVKVAPRKSVEVTCVAPDRIYVTHLALPSSIASRLRVLFVRIGLRLLLEGPYPGELFAVRIPEDRRQPIDRGGPLGKGPFLIMGEQVTGKIRFENTSDDEIEVLGALFGSAEKPATISVLGNSSNSSSSGKPAER